MSGRLAARAGGALERRVSRRGLLARMTLGGSALAVAPLRYLLRPGTAWGVLRPAHCGPGTRCNDGYTAFCCEIQNGSNHCPRHTYVAGWWKCTDYKGHGLCGPQGHRYYIDCNRTPGAAFPGGCRCAQDDCGRRRVDCNHFRYGQCNTQVSGTTEVVCRVVVCRHPATVAGFNCNRTLKVDNTTCAHSAGCLKDVVVQLPGAGGRVMEILVAAETVLLVLLLLLVAGLLRSNAEILRRLGPEEEEEAGELEVRRAPEPASAPDREPEPPAQDVAGVTLAGDAVQVGLAAGSPPTLLAFLSSGCTTCRPFWDGFARGSAGLPGDLRVVILPEDGARESPSRLRQLAGEEAPVVLSSAAWTAYGVPASPYFVLASEGRIRGEGSAEGWAQLSALLADALDDARPGGGAARTRRADAALAAAGVGPGHASLEPDPPA